MYEDSQDTRPALRAGDAERERTAEALRRAHAEGRLDVDELQDRIGRCYAARTVGELARLVSDLPAEGIGSPHPSRRPPVRHVRLALALAVAIAALLTAVVHGQHVAGPPIGLLIVLWFLWLRPHARRRSRRLPPPRSL